MTTTDTKVATPCVPQSQQHSNESQNYDNFEKCEEHKLEELANRIGARHEQPVYDEHESLKEHDDLCHPAEKIYRDYLGAVHYGNIFSINIGPDYSGKIRAIDAQTLKQVGDWIREGHVLPE